jgi:hypothetical protein
MTVFSLVACAQEGGAKESLSLQDGEITASVDLRCLTENRFYLADDLLLNARPYPYVTSAFVPVALSCSIKPGDQNWASSGQGQTCRTSIVTVNYGKPTTRSVGSFPIVAESIEPMGEFVRLDYRMFRWGSKNGPPLTPEEAPGVFLPKCKIVRKLYRLSSIPSLAMSAFGKCNSNSYTSPLLGVSFAAETLTYDAPSFDRTITTTGSEGWNYTQNWLYNPQGWNRYFRAETNSYEYIYRADVSGASVRHNNYLPADLSSLFL